MFFRSIEEHSMIFMVIRRVLNVLILREVKTSSLNVYLTDLGTYRGSTRCFKRLPAKNAKNTRDLGAHFTSGLRLKAIFECLGVPWSCVCLELVLEGVLKVCVVECENESLYIGNGEGGYSRQVPIALMAIDLIASNFILSASTVLHFRIKMSVNLLYFSNLFRKNTINL